MHSHEIHTTIFLTGFMGSGKSTIGPILANTLGYEFVDLDSAVEKAAGQTVTEIFRTRGEDGFRTLEREVLEEVTGKGTSVIALGGGTIVDPSNLRLIQQKGVLVYLNISRDRLVERLKRKRTRPILMTPSGDMLDSESLKQKVTTLIDSRSPLYAKADITVESGTQPVGVTVDEIVRQLGRLHR